MKLFILIILLCQLSNPPSFAQEPEELRELDIAELKEIKVITATRKPEKLFHVAAAISVITSDDIRRSGARSIPELLRMVPGFDIARIDSSRYAISARGFNEEIANKLLVLIDGRTVYTPLFAGVFWEKQDTLLEDIDRIEVIRGPGGALWEANAVNGIINIITQSARNTQGWLTSGGTGNEERGFGSIRYGEQVTENAFFRTYAKYSNRGTLAGDDLSGGLRLGQGGFRADWNPPKNTLTFQGDIYESRAGQTLQIATQIPPSFTQTKSDDVIYTGGNILARWVHEGTHQSETRLQTYYDRSHRESKITSSLAVENTWDMDFQHRFLWGNRQEWVGGLEYRLVTDNSRGSFVESLDPARRITRLYSAFIYDDIQLLIHHLRLTLGSKFEHNDFTGLEIQPNVRMIWTPNERNTFWAAFSRAVRTPSRAGNDIHFSVTTLPGPVVVRWLGNPDLPSEKLLAYELGYRVQPADQLSLDLATFFNVYDDLRSFEPGAPNTVLIPPELPILLDSKLRGNTYGVEFAANWEYRKGWNLRPSYSYLKMHLDTAADSRDTGTALRTKGSSPEHQFTLRSQMNLANSWELDGMLRTVGQLPSLNIPSYTTLDLRLGWHVTQNLEISVIGQSLLQNRHSEFLTIRAPSSSPEVERSIYGELTWHL